MLIKSEAKGFGVRKLAAAYVGLNVLDLLLTKQAIGQGAIELNPIMRYMLNQPELILWGFKVGVAAFFAVLLLLLHKRFEKPISTIFKLLVVAMGGICLFGITTLVLQ